MLRSPAMQPYTTSRRATSTVDAASSRLWMSRLRFSPNVAGDHAAAGIDPPAVTGPYSRIRVACCSPFRLLHRQLILGPDVQADEAHVPQLRAHAQADRPGQFSRVVRPRRSDEGDHVHLCAETLDPQVLDARPGMAAVVPGAFRRRFDCARDAARIEGAR